jgi:hypothetical protein
MGSLPTDTAAPVPVPSPQRLPAQAEAPGALYGDAAGPAFGGGSPVTDFPPILGLAPTAIALTDADSAAYAGPAGSAHAPPHFYKLDFLTFDDVVDPLN